MPKKKPILPPNTELITPDKEQMVRGEFQKGLVQAWKTCSPICPKMILDFHIHFMEVYSSRPGYILTLTPFWRGSVFTKGVLSHELYHWSIYPKDMWRGLEDLFRTRELLAKDSKFTPKKVKEGLFEEKEDWTGFKYSIPEIQFIQNILGDYLINLHIAKRHPELWEDLWQFLFKDGTFYEGAKAKQRDTTFMLYLSVYPRFLSTLVPIQLLTPEAERDSEKIFDIMTNVMEGQITYPFATKELTKIFHKYVQADEQEGQGKEGKGEDAKCPQCGHDEFEVMGWWDENGKYVPTGKGGKKK